MKLPDDLTRSLCAMGLLELGVEVEGERLTGGVSSDIWRVDLPRPICVKLALEQLNVAQEWRVSVERNAYEVAWFKVVAGIVPEAVPKILGHDPAAGVFAMDYLAPDKHPVWKSQLLAGVVEPYTAVALAHTLTAIHSGTSNNQKIAEQFDTDKLFYELRSAPYLLATADVHPDLRPQLEGLVSSLMANKKTLVHGDISPKNILVADSGPVILDAECAWYGDPAFDVAFCLNHLLLKCVHRPETTAGYLSAFQQFVDQYLAGVDWEPVAVLEQRVAHLLPGLLLGRIDGKSPVEYITGQHEKDAVRQFARQLLQFPVARLAIIAERWQQFTEKNFVEVK